MCSRRRITSRACSCLRDTSHCDRCRVRIDCDVTGKRREAEVSLTTAEPHTLHALTASRPEHPLVHTQDGSNTLVDEFLNPLPLVSLRRIHVALGVGRDTVNGKELTRLAAAVAEHREYGQGLPIHHVDTLVPAVCEIDVFLLWISRERNVPHRPVATRERKDALLLHELAVLAEDLDAIVHAIADVHEPIVGRLRAVHRVPELWR